MHENRSSSLVRASLIALVGNAILAMAKLAVGLFSGSLAVLGDGIDSATDVLIAIVALVAARVVDKPGDKEHPYGHSRAETIATSILAFVVFMAGAQFLMATIGRLVSSEPAAIPDPISIYVTLVSIAGKLLLAWSQFSIGKRVGSAMLMANGKNMRGDVLTSSAVLVGLVFTFVLKMPVLDIVAALFVSLWIIKNAIGIIMEANLELMDGTQDQEVYRRIFEAVSGVEGAGNPHRTRARKLASRVFVDLDIEVKPDLSVAAGHDIAVAVEKAIKEADPEVYDVIVHVEPAGNDEVERFGLNPDYDAGGK